MPTRFPPAFDAFVEPARAHSALWRTLLGFVMIAVLFLTITVSLSMLLLYLGERIRPGLGSRLVYDMQTGESPFGTMALLGILAMMIPVLALVLRVLHKRDLRSVLGPSRRIDKGVWVMSAAIVLALGGANAALTFATEDVTQQWPVLTWLPLAALGLVFVLLQTSAEELVFRGYLQQQLAARFHSRFAWQVVPSLLFGSMHWNPATFGDNAWLVVATATLIGLIASDLTYRLGTLSAAMGLHFANNAIVMVFLNVQGQLSGVSLFLYEQDAKSPETGTGLLISMGAMVLIYGVFLFIHRRRR